MRPQITTTATTTTTTLQTILAALPTERLAELVLALANGGTSAPAAIADPPPDSKPRQHRRRVRASRPAGKPRRGRPPKAATAPAETEAAKPRGRPRHDEVERAARRNANKRAARARRAAERAAQQATAPAIATPDVAKPVNTSSNGTAGNGKKGEAAKSLWEHAAKLDSKSPWRAVANEFELNKQQTLDAYRLHALPPGVTVDAVERFLELPVE